MTDHLRLDLDLVELLAGVDADDAADHLGNDNHVTEVSLDEVGLLVGLGLLLGLSELLDQAHGLTLETPVDPAAGTGVDDIAELIGAEVEEAIRNIQSAYILSLSKPRASSVFVFVWSRGHPGLSSRGGGQWCVEKWTTYASRSIPR